jgi:myosin-5
LFEYTGQSGIISIEGLSDEKEFEDMQNSMSILRFSPAEKNEVFKIVAGVLHFGNVKFRVEKKATEEDGSSISNPELVTHAANMWGINAKEISKSLISRNIGSKETIIKGLSVAQALDTRDAMTKRVYSELFQFVVNKINVELSSSGKARHRFIGVLDIFGFESFEVSVYFFHYIL